MYQTIKVALTILGCLLCCGCDIRARPKAQLPDKGSAAKVTVEDTALLSDAIAHQVELANADPGRRDTSSAVAQSITRFGAEAGFPADYLTRLTAAVPKINQTPPVAMTVDDIAAIRKVR